jgi:hypothetical protein
MTHLSAQPDTTRARPRTVPVRTRLPQKGYPYLQASEEQLLAWLEEKSPELAEIMRAIRRIPDEEQQYILEALARDLEAIQREQRLGVRDDADA